MTSQILFDWLISSCETDFKVEINKAKKQIKLVWNIFDLDSILSYN